MIFSRNNYFGKKYRAGSLKKKEHRFLKNFNTLDYWRLSCSTRSWSKLSVLLSYYIFRRYFKRVVQSKISRCYVVTSFNWTRHPGRDHAFYLINVSFYLFYFLLFFIFLFIKMARGLTHERKSCYLALRNFWAFSCSPTSLVSKICLAGFLVSQSWTCIGPRFSANFCPILIG